MEERDVHLCELRRCTAGNLLCSELNELLLEFLELLLEIVLVLAPELGRLDLSGRLPHISCIRLSSDTLLLPF